MKSNFNLAVLLLIALVSGFSIVPAHALLASPPPGLTAIFDDMTVFETAFKAGKWDKAKRAAGMIDKTVNQMMPQLKRDLNGDTEKIYKGIIYNIKQSTEKRNNAKVQFHFIELHYFIFSLISKYEYTSPPVFTIINKYIIETEEALESKKYTRVISELDEITDMVSFVQNHLVRNDAMRGYVDEIKAKLKETRVAAQSKHYEEVRDGISSLKIKVEYLLLEIKKVEKL